MKKLLIYSAIISLIFGLNGCASQSKSITWDERAGFYSCNYPTSTRIERCEMFIEELRDAKENFKVINKYYKVREMWVYVDGKLTWPIERVSLIKGDYLSGDVTEYLQGEQRLAYDLDAQKKQDSKIARRWIREQLRNKKNAKKDS